MSCLMFCCICTNKNDLEHLFNVDNEGVSHYNKLTSSIAEMNFKEMNDQRLICGECCVTLNTVYNFRQTCLRSKTNLITYISQLQTFNHVSDTTSDPLEVKSELIDVKEETESEIEDNYCFEENDLDFKTESYEESIQFPALVKEECKEESSTHEYATVDQMNASHRTMIEDEPYIKVSKIDTEEDPLAAVKEEPMSDSETPQDSSTSQAVVTSENTDKDAKKLHKCEICGRNFLKKTNYNYHMRIHSGERPYECEICHKNYVRKTHLTKHVRIHSGEKSYECEICKKSYVRQTDLTMHLLIHYQYKQYQCEICKKGFSNKRHFAMHMNIHSGEKQYECKTCKKSFIQKSNLTMHMKVHSGERPYECEICKKTFIRKDKLISHMRSHSADVNISMT